MKIAGVRILEVTGTATFDGPRHEEPLGTPAQLYAEFRGDTARRREAATENGPWTKPLRQLFLEIETDGGAVGRIGPLGPRADEIAFLLARQLGPFLVGKDPRQIARLWDLMYRWQMHGRAGLMMQAISAVDCALWDLRARAAGEPLYRLLGGPCQDRLRAYAAMKGVSQDPATLAAEAQGFAAAGFGCVKVYLNQGPWDGAQGMRHNEESVATLRAALGPDVDLAIDCWQSWEPGYTRAMMPRLAPHRIAWLEEPFIDHQLAAYAELRRHAPFPIACGEHAYTRWEFAQIVDAGAADIVQPDVCWAGGVSESLKIVAVASARGVPVYFHTHCLKASVHLIAAQAPTACPLIEVPAVPDTYVNEYFLRHRTVVRDGCVELPQEPGLGLELDPARIGAVRELTF